MFAGGGGKRTTTTGTGAYTLSGLPPGLWEVYFTGCGKVNYVSQWWGGQATMTTAKGVTVTAGKTTAAISATLAAGGEISGTVTAAGGSTGIGGVCVFGLDSSGELTGIATGSATTVSSGAYTIAGLPSGEYEVEFVPCSNKVNVLPTFWDTSDQSLVTAVTVKAPDTTSGISVAMSPGGSISGTVTSAATGKGVGGICVDADQPTVYIQYFGTTSVSSFLIPSTLGSSVTASDGTYAISGLPAGDYSVAFASCAQPTNLNYALPATYHQTSDPTVMPPVVVTAGSTTAGIDYALNPGGKVIGYVTDSTNHKPVAGICVSFVNSSFTYFDLAGETGAQGTYLAEGIAPGTYQAQFAPCGNANWLGSQWNNGASLTVKANGVTSGISGTVSPGGLITGTVTTTSGVPLTDLCVVLSQSSQNGGSIELIGPIGFAGSYKVGQLPSGDYSVGFADGCFLSAAGNFATSFWDNGKAVAVKAGGPPVTGIDVKLGPGGQITGTVRDNSSHPLTGMCVLALPVSGGLNTFELSTLSFFGTYDIPDLSTGTYQVQFEPCDQDNYLMVEYGGGHAVSVTTGKTVSGVSAVLQPGGAISGTVMNATHVGLSNICIDAFTASSQLPLPTITVFGSYELTGVTPNVKYDIEFSSCFGPNYVTQWWDDVPTQATATSVTVTVASPATNIDAVMVAGVAGRAAHPGSRRVAG
jgi:hypothetical protein